MKHKSTRKHIWCYMWSFRLYWFWHFLLSSSYSNFVYDISFTFIWCFLTSIDILEVFLCLYLLSTTLKRSCQDEDANTRHCIVFLINVFSELCVLSAVLFIIFYMQLNHSLRTHHYPAWSSKVFKGAAIYVFYLIIHLMPRRSM